MSNIKHIRHNITKNKLLNYYYIIYDIYLFMSLNSNLFVCFLNVFYF